METGNLYLDGEERFGRFASRLYSFFSSAATGKYIEDISVEIAARNPLSVLDVGTGPGNLLIALSRATGHSEIYGVDPSGYMVSIARKKIRKAGLSSRIRVEPGSSRYIPFDSRFDLIVSSFSFHHWKEKLPSMRYLSQRLNEDGKIIIFEMNPDSYPGSLPGVRKHAFSHSDRKMLIEDGFTVNEKTLGGGRLLALELFR